MYLPVYAYCTFCIKQNVLQFIDNLRQVGVLIRVNKTEILLLVVVITIALAIAPIIIHVR